MSWHCLTLVSASLLLAGFPAAADERTSEPVDVGFLSRLDGTEQRYVLLLPPGFQNTHSCDVMIALHGHGSDRWQFVRDPRPECSAAREAAARHGMLFVSPDYRAATSWMGPAAEADVLQILDDLNSQFRIRNVVICGGSMGGTGALSFAALHPDCVDGVVAMNGTANLVEYNGFPEAIAASYGGSRGERPEVYRTRSAEYFPERLTMPVAATTGGQDRLVPPDSVLRLMQALETRGTPARLIHRPERGHDTSNEDARAAFEFVLSHPESSRKPYFDLLNGLDSARPIVCIGDSVTGVYYHTGGRRAYPEMLEVALSRARPDAGWRVINAGISGQTTADGLQRLETDVLVHEPAVVTISFGLNDVTRIPLDDFRSHLMTMVTACRQKGSLVVLCTPNAVITTDSRPVERLSDYCNVIREVAGKTGMPVCDQWGSGERLRQRAPRTWRLTLSDEIHPNMDGHRRMSEELCQVLTGTSVSLQDVEPPSPVLLRLSQLTDTTQPVRVLAMSPVADQIDATFHALNRPVDLTVWDVAGLTLPQLQAEAQSRVRAMRPDLVVLTVPDGADATSEEEAIHGISWLMNWSLSFGQQEWDCAVVHPAVIRRSGPSGSDHIARDNLIRQLVHAQHLPLIDGEPGIAQADAENLITGWFQHQLQP